MFVSRKNLSLIHLFPREMPACPHRLDPAHELIEACRVRARRCVLRQPVAESVIQGLALVVSDLAGLIDQIFIGTEGDVSHGCSVHENRAHCNQLQRRFLIGSFAAVYRHPAGRAGDNVEADAGGVWGAAELAELVACHYSAALFSSAPAASARLSFSSSSTSAAASHLVDILFRGFRLTPA